MTPSQTERKKKKKKKEKKKRKKDIDTNKVGENVYLNASLSFERIEEEKQTKRRIVEEDRMINDLNGVVRGVVDEQRGFLACRVDLERTMID